MDPVRYHILRELSTGPKTYWQLLAQGSFHPSSLIEALTALQEAGVITYPSKAFVLTREGREQLERLGPRERVPGLCPRCRGRAYVIPPALEGVLKELERIARDRPPATQEFDQGPIPPENALLRVVALYERGDLEGKDLVILGDDDLTSVAAALTGLPRSIQVLEADPRLVEFLATLSQRDAWKGFRVDRYDVRQPLPPAFSRAFDTFFTDPTETLLGFSLFLSRATMCLRGQGAVGYFGLSHLEASRKKWQEIQRRLLQMNFVITDTLRGFHEYTLDPDGIMAQEYRVVTKCPFEPPKPDLNWYTSTLFRVELVGEPAPLLEGTVSLSRDLYYDEEAYVTLP